MGYAGRAKKLELLCPVFSFFFCEGNKVSTFLFLYEKNNYNMYIQIYKDILKTCKNNLQPLVF